MDTNSRAKRRRERDVNFALKAKRQRIHELDEDDSEDEYKPAHEEESDSEDSAGSGVPEDEVSEVEEFSEEDSPIKKVSLEPYVLL